MLIMNTIPTKKFNIDIQKRRHKLSLQKPNSRFLHRKKKRHKTVFINSKKDQNSEKSAEISNDSCINQ